MFIMACDERGSIYRYSRSQSWVYGGIIFDAKHRKPLIDDWNTIKIELCGDSNAELKWSHFFIQSSDNPLLDQSNVDNQLSWALDTIFENTYIVTPISTRVPKGRSSEACFVTTSKGNQVLDYEVLSVPVFGQFALFLKLTKSSGEMWFDQLGSEKEQDRKQNSWNNLWKNTPTREYKRMLQRIKPKIKFFDSKNEPIIQVADFVSGVIWAASEGEEKHLITHFESYFPNWWDKINLVTIT